MAKNVLSTLQKNVREADKKLRKTTNKFTHAKASLSEYADAWRAYDSAWRMLKEHKRPMQIRRRMKS